MSENYCCEDMKTESSVGGVDLATGAQYETLYCANCGRNLGVERFKTWRGEELERLRREAQISPEALDEAMDAIRALYEVGRVDGKVVTFNPEVFDRFTASLRKVYYEPVED